MPASGIEQELSRFKAELWEAAMRKDRDRLGHLIHDELILLGPKGHVVGKQDCLSGLTDPATHLAEGWERVERKTSATADGRMVTEVSDVEVNGVVQGEDWSGRYVNTATYVRGAGGWQLLGSTWQVGTSSPGCCGSIALRQRTPKCAVCGREGAHLLAGH